MQRPSSLATSVLQAQAAPQDEICCSQVGYPRRWNNIIQLDGKEGGEGRWFNEMIYSERKSKPRREKLQGKIARKRAQKNSTATAPDWANVIENLVRMRQACTSKKQIRINRRPTESVAITRHPHHISFGELREVYNKVAATRRDRG